MVIAGVQSVGCSRISHPKFPLQTLPYILYYFPTPTPTAAGPPPAQLYIWANRYTYLFGHKWTEDGRWSPVISNSAWGNNPCDTCATETCLLHSFLTQLWWRRGRGVSSIKTDLVKHHVHSAYFVVFAMNVSRAAIDLSMWSVLIQICTSWGIVMVLRWIWWDRCSAGKKKMEDMTYS